MVHNLTLIALLVHTDLQSINTYFLNLPRATWQLFGNPHVEVILSDGKPYCQNESHELVQFLWLLFLKRYHGEEHSKILEGTMAKIPAVPIDMYFVIPKSPLIRQWEKLDYRSQY